MTSARRGSVIGQSPATIELNFQPNPKMRGPA